MLVIHPKSINGDKFREFVQYLRKKYPFRKMGMYLDNLSFHHSKDT